MAGMASALRAEPEQNGWSFENRLALKKILKNPVGCAVFDFDNTLICRDIGEAVLAELAVSTQRPEMLDHYLALLHRAEGSDTAESAQILMQSAFNFAVQAFASQSVQSICGLTAAAYAAGIAQRDFADLNSISVSADQRFLRPMLFPEMVELCAELFKRGVACYIVSASNVWSVRWLALNAINPRLRDLGVEVGFEPQNVFGISTRLEWQGRYYSDRELVKHPDYALLDPRFLRNVTASENLTPPIPSFEGKAAVVHELIDPEPYLVAGDSVYDLPMLKLAKHRIWLNKTGIPVEAKILRELQDGMSSGELVIQAIRTKERPGLHGN